MLSAPLRLTSENGKPSPLFFGLSDLVPRQLDGLTQPMHTDAWAMIDDRAADGYVGPGDARHAPEPSDHGAHAVHAGHALDVKDRSHDLTR